MPRRGEEVRPRSAGLAELVHDHVSSPARILEVGCGRGDLAHELASDGYAMTAIDPEAPEGEIFRRVALEDFATDERFDAVVASRSIHHIDDLRGAVDKMAGLLAPAGLVVVNEHAHERFDESTAWWYRDRLDEVGRAPRSVESCLREWRDEHRGLHGSVEMRRELDRRFRERFFEWRPYLHGELGGAVTEDQERRSIAAGAIRATGFRYVGERR